MFLLPSPEEAEEYLCGVSSTVTFECFRLVAIFWLTENSIFRMALVMSFSSSPLDSSCCFTAAGLRYGEDTGVALTKRKERKKSTHNEHELLTRSKR